MSRFENIFSILFCLVCAALFAYMPIRDTDTYYHLAAGKWMVEQKSVPKKDFWSFTAPGERWITHEWLYEVLLYILHRLGGMKALVIFKTILAGVCLLIVDKTARLFKVNSRIRYPLIFLIALLAAPRFNERPHLLTFCFGALMIFILERALQKRESGDEKALNMLWILVPLVWIWGNCHAGVLYAYIIGTAYCLDFLFKGKRINKALFKSEQHKNRDFMVSLGVGLGVMIAPFLNPNHVWTILYPFTLMAKMKASHFTTYEFQSIPAGEESTWQRWLVVLLILLQLLQIKKRPVRETFLTVILGAYGFHWFRERSFFFLIISPFSMNIINETFNKIKGTKKRHLLHIFTGVSLLGIGISMACPNFVLLKREMGGDPLMPEQIVKFHKDNRLPSHVFHPMAWGGYLLWTSSDHIKVFLDARLDVFPPNVLSDYLTIKAFRPGAEALLKKYHINCCLVDYSEFYPETPTSLSQNMLGRALFHDPDWALVYWGDEGMIFLRREIYEKDYPHLPQWKYVNPEVKEFESYIQKGSVEYALEEMKIHTSLYPECLRSQRFLGFLLLSSERFQEASETFERVIEHPRAKPEDFHALAFAQYNEKDPDSAMITCSSGLKRFPDSPLLLEYVGFLLSQQGRWEEALKYLFKARQRDRPSYERELLLSWIYEKLGNRQASRRHHNAARKLQKK